MPTKKRILLVLGGGLRAQASLAHILQAHGNRVSESETLAGAREMIIVRVPDLVILPDEMAAEDPFELAAELVAQHPDLPLILVGRKTTGELLLKGMHYRFLDYLSLPVEEERLLQAVRRASEHKSGWERWLRKETGRLTGSLNQRLSELETILKQVDDGVIVLDESARIVMINRAVRRAFDLGERDVLGARLETVFSNEDLLAALNGQGESASHTEIEGRDKHHYSLRVTPIPEIGTVASLHDISYLKELDRLRGDFVNTVSHDLRSPLTAILGYVELIERSGPINPQQAEFVRRVKSSVHATTDLIGDLLNLGRVEVGMLDNLESVKLPEIVAEAVEAVMGRVEQRRQTLRMNMEGEIPTIAGSPVQLRQVVDNLVGNAVKYSPEGGEIRLLLRREDDQVILHVADNGPGIPTSEHQRIFEKFYRSSDVDASVQGTGLGLAIVKTVVDNHRGRIWVDSKPGGGSVFTVVLPVEQRD